MARFKAKAAAAVLLGICGLAMVAAAFWMLAAPASSARAYDGLSALADPAALAAEDGQAQPADDGGRIAWGEDAPDGGASAGDGSGDGAGWGWGMSSGNPDYRAWLRVPGAGISLPVCCDPPRAPGRYLYADFWGGPGGAGCPYLDAATPDASGRLRVVYGHNMGYEWCAIFDHIHSPWQAALSGAMEWTPDGEPGEWLPFAFAFVGSNAEAFLADSELEGALASDEGLRDWLERLLARADVSSEGARERVRNASACTLAVTCTGFWASERTYVAYVR